MKIRHSLNIIRSFVITVWYLWNYRLQDDQRFVMHTTSDIEYHMQLYDFTWDRVYIAIKIAHLNLW